MVRKLMLILGLSFSVAAIGCGDDETSGTGGNGGTGGTPGACTNTADETIICEAGFPAAVQACGTSNLGDAEAIAMCVEDDIGLSTECASCFGETTQCTIDNCITQCGTDPLGDACTDCRATNCDPAFEACAGDLPPCENGGGGNGGNGGMGGSSM